MSSNGGASNFGNQNEPVGTEETVLEDRSRSHSSNLGRAVTDAVHERFRQSFVYCDNCKENFIGNGVSIHKHFTKSHPADVQCIYCAGKVFHYYRVKSSNNKEDKVYYHCCRDWFTK